LKLLLVTVLAAAFYSGPTFPPIDDYPDPGGSKLVAEVEMPECYPCGSNVV
jgi:hypothetical protein